jgi:hypothetical protein
MWSSPEICNEVSRARHKVARGQTAITELTATGSGDTFAEIDVLNLLSCDAVG